jgi:hypothetical protein
MMPLPNKCRESVQPDKLRLILGPGRSGTSWLSKVLGKTNIPLRFINEPLYHYSPKLQFSKRYDHTAISYQPNMRDDHPLLKAYQSFTFSSFDWKKYLPSQLLLRDDREFSICLIKEVHSLLATEALLKKLKCQTIFITRDPLYVVDSLLSFRGLDAPIWRNETKYIREGHFLERFLPGRKNNIRKKLWAAKLNLNKRERVTTEKVLTVAVINKMLEKLALHFSHVTHISYEKICAKPNEVISYASNFLNLEAGKETFRYLKATQSVANQNDPYSVFRDTRGQLTRAFRFLSLAEVKTLRRMLDYCQLL